MQTTTTLQRYRVAHPDIPKEFWELIDLIEKWPLRQQLRENEEAYRAQPLSEIAKAHPKIELWAVGNLEYIWGQLQKAETLCTDFTDYHPNLPLLEKAKQIMEPLQSGSINWFGPFWPVFRNTYNLICSILKKYKQGVYTRYLELAEQYFNDCSDNWRCPTTYSLTTAAEITKRNLVIGVNENTVGCSNP
jgi:hypothetical protein